MVTILERETQESVGHGGRYCDGCPRCTDSEASFCKQQHPVHSGNSQGLHPVCRRCGHCVLSGSHNDNTDDLV